MPVFEPSVDQPDLEACALPSGKEGYRLVASWAYTWHTGYVLRQLRIKAGFEHDGASVPRLAWTLVGLTPSGLISAAALAHDWLYRNGGRFPAESLWEQPDQAQGWVDVSDGLVCTRNEADRLFARIMREAGVRVTKRRLAYWAVRAWAWRQWRAPR